MQGSMVPLSTFQTSIFRFSIVYSVICVIYRSVRTLTIPVPWKREPFNLFFFISLEKAFRIKNVPAELKTEILINLLGERVGNLLMYVEEQDEKIKTLTLKEFQPTPFECLNQYEKVRNLSEIT
ncbi:uncharacterized protein CEXT_645621 [Caerostris extrusa]|uniref:Uncharacterized protein n=1 Tax=Caerostris extrusa TaxID=172846 RepID=A0AAV4MU48_CAEEX|nr:uncharacterized protein CEXT_645621 [Caerostris extrusa]